MSNDHSTGQHPTNAEIVQALDRILAIGRRVNEREEHKIPHTEATPEPENER